MAALSWKDGDFRCITCGRGIPDGLARLGAVLCHDCRQLTGVEVVVAHTTRRRRRSPAALLRISLPSRRDRP
jgi:hypothetical protein